MPVHYVTQTKNSLNIFGQCVNVGRPILDKPKRRLNLPQLSSVSLNSSWHLIGTTRMATYDILAISAAGVVARILS